MINGFPISQNKHIWTSNPESQYPIEFPQPVGLQSKGSHLFQPGNELLSFYDCVLPMQIILYHLTQMHWVFDRSNITNNLQKLPLSAVPVQSCLFPMPFSSPLFFLRWAQLPGSDNYIFSRAMELMLLPTKFKRVTTIFMAKTPCLWRYLTEEKDGAFLTARLAKIQNKKSFACAHRK